MGEKIKLWIWAVVKVACMIAVIIFIRNLMSSGKISNASFSDVEAQVTEAADLTNMQLADNQMIKRLYGLAPDDYEGIELYYPVTNMGAEELLIIKLKDISQQETVQAAIESRIATQKKSFEGYGVEQTAMLENSIMKVEGNFALLIVAEDPSPVANAFEAAIGGN